jgi:ketosteroid isomerase-like protein
VVSAAAPGERLRRGRRNHIVVARPGAPRDTEDAMTDPGFHTYMTSLDELFRSGDSKSDEKREEASNIQLINDVVAAFGWGDLAAVGEQLADGARLDIRGADELPFVRSASGRDEVLEALRQNFAAVREQRPSVEAVVAQGDTVVIMLAEEGEVRATGERYRVQGVQRYVCRDGKIELVQELILPA